MLPKLSVKKPMTIFVAVIVVIVLGIVSVFKMTPDLLPNMDFHKNDFYSSTDTPLWRVVPFDTFWV